MATKQVAPGQVESFIQKPVTTATTRLNDDVPEDIDIGADEAETGESGGGFSIKFSDIKGLPSIDDDKYDVVIREAKPGMSKKKQPKMDLTLVIENCENDALNGRKIYDTLSFADNAKWRVKLFLLALGYEEDFEGEITPQELVGSHLCVTVATEADTQINPDTGKPYTPRPRVKAFSPEGSNSTIDDVLSI